MDFDELSKMYDFTGMSVTITGGAGILGGELACALVGMGANVAVLDRSPEMAERLIHRWEPARGRAIIVYGDVLDPEIMQQTAERVLDEFGRIDCLINAAGGNNLAALRFFFRRIGNDDPAGTFLFFFLSNDQHSVV